jgi:hypothetical protein
LLIVLLVMTLPLSQAKAQPSNKEKEIHCLAQVMYFERYQGSDESKKADAWVMRNRLFDDYFPFSHCENIYKHNQFPWVYKSITDKKEWDRSLVLADYMYHKGFYQEDDPTYGSTFFASKEDGWFSYMIKTNQFEKKADIEGHRYYFWKSKKVE